jgi:RNA polymerase sigma factor (sigma-70 family)
MTTIQDELIARCKNGDSSAFTELYNLHSAEVYGTIYNLVQHTAEAEDILQEAFVAAYHGIAKYEYTGGFRAWVKRIAINKALSKMRRVKMKFVELQEGNEQYEPDEEPDEDEMAFRMEEVQRAIATLPENYRTVFQLYAVDDISQAEIGLMLGISTGAVKVAYHRAKQRLLKTLKESVHHEK